jgi:acyl transferase domain-containing protein
VLRRLDSAIAAQDRIAAVLRASGIAHNAGGNGLTAPNGAAQESLLRTVLSQSGMTAADIGYVEAHGTGTRLGDPIEAEAIGAVYCAGRSADHPLFVGSSKANFGHL